MPRRARLGIAGIPWHVIQRGHNRAACFFADRDYRVYLDCLHELARRFGCAVHAYVLMTNHVHLLLTPTRENGVALLMKHLGQRYVQYVNRTYGRSGTLWEGRYRSCLTQSENYVLACYRYIELNPVRAGMVSRPDDYRWSSYSANGLGRADGFITPQEEYLRLAQHDGARREAYRGLFNAQVNAETVKKIRQATNGNLALGESRFQKEVERTLGVRARRARPGRPRVAEADSSAVLDLP